MTLRNWHYDLQTAIRSMLKDDNADPDAQNGFYCVHTFIENKIIRARMGLGEAQLVDMGITKPYATVGVMRAPKELNLPSTAAIVKIDLYANKDEEIAGKEVGVALQLLAARIDTLLDGKPGDISAKKSNLIVAHFEGTFSSEPYYSDELKAYHLTMSYDVQVHTSD